jgi:hypothetical protein
MNAPDQILTPITLAAIAWAALVVYVGRIGAKL